MAARIALRAACCAAVLMLPLLALAASQGSIDSPRGQVSAGRMIVRGTLAKMSDGERYWLVVRKGELMWPKVRVRAEPIWEAMIEEPTAPGGRFSIVLLAVTPKGDQQIQVWLGAGRIDSTYAPLTEIAGAAELDSVDVKAK